MALSGPGSAALLPMPTSTGTLRTSLADNGVTSEREEISYLVVSYRFSQIIILIVNYRRQSYYLF